MRTIRSVCAAEQPCNECYITQMFISELHCMLHVHYPVVYVCYSPRVYVTLVYSNVCSSSSSCPFPSEGNRALVTLPKCSRVLRSVTSSVNIPSTMETSVLLSKLGGLDTTGTPNLNQCLRPKL